METGWQQNDQYVKHLYTKKDTRPLLVLHYQTDIPVCSECKIITILYHPQTSSSGYGWTDDSLWLTNYIILLNHKSIYLSQASQFQHFNIYFITILLQSSIFLHSSPSLASDVNVHCFLCVLRVCIRAVSWPYNAGQIDSLQHCELFLLSCGSKDT